MLASILGLPKQAEILIIIFLGICFLSLDFSLFHLHEDVAKIWNLRLEKSKCLELPLKYVIIAIVLIRTFTLHIFLAFHVIMLWPAIFEERASLMIPWLALGLLRCLILSFITFSIGLFICQKEKGFSPICFYFVLAQIIQHGPSIYAWFCVLGFYRKISVVPTLKENQKIVNEFIVKPKSHSYSDLEDLQDSEEIFIGLEENLSSSTCDYYCESTIMDKIMNTLKISKEDVQKASESKDNFANVLLEISVKDLEEIGFTRGNNMTKNYSQTALSQKPSNQTLNESEVLDEDDKDLDNLMIEFNPSEFLQNFLMKKNTSRNFGCQVSMLKKGFFEKSKNQVAKKLLFLRNFGLYQTN